MAPSKRPLIFKKIREERGETHLLQVATFGTEGTKSAILTACRGYRGQGSGYTETVVPSGKQEIVEIYKNGIDIDEAQYIASLIPQERGFLWTLNDVVKGNPVKDRKPIPAFINEVNKYPGLLEIIYGIDGLINKRSQHASGVILYNTDPWEDCALMRSPNGDLITQFDLHHAEAMGNTKFDYLVTDICDKITNAIILLQRDNKLPADKSLRDIYNEYLHPNAINLKDDRIWDTLASGKVVDLFQFDSPVGGQAIKSILPRNPLQMMMANALTRLTGEKGQERPIEKYVRFKNNIQNWYNECKQWGLSEEEIKVLEPYYLPVSGVPTTQEKLMLLCMDPKIAHFSLAEANAARKVCSKKLLNKIPELREKFISQCQSKRLGEYVWFSAIEPQMSYAFAEPHALAYSFIAIQILLLATYYPIIYWNCACLITNSGGSLDEDIEIDDDSDEDEEEEEEIEKKQKNTDYGKISTAIGNFKAHGINVLPPDINNSSYTFTPIVTNNTILYGLRGITRISVDLIKTIIANRPYESMIDFLNRIKVNKVQMINLIKCGAFDTIEHQSREDIMKNYLELIADKKERLTLQNMQMLITKQLIPEEMSYYSKLFSFNKFLKTKKIENCYKLNDAAIKFISDNFDADIIIDGEKVRQTVWDNLYKKTMEPMRVYLKNHKEEMLTALNHSLYMDVAEKYGQGTISKWEMDSISFYYHEHELSNAAAQYDDFFSLDEEPEIEYSFESRNGQMVNMYKLHHIIGTVIDKNKMRNTVTLLTPTGVVLIKIYKNQFPIYDKQLSEKGPDGVKHVIEASWFKRGTLLMIQGIRRGNEFVPKKTKKSVFPIISKIIEIKEDGQLVFQYERQEVDM